MTHDISYPQVTRTGLWLGLVGGGAAWMLHLLLAWTIAEFGCVAGLGKVQASGISMVSWMLIAASLFCLALALVATWTAQRARKELLSGIQEGNELFTAQTGLAVGLWILCL